MSEGGQMIICICAGVVSLGVILAIVGFVAYERGYRKGCKETHPRGTEGPEFMATDCMFRGREVYLYVEGYGDLDGAHDAARDFARTFNEGLDVRTTLNKAGHFCDNLRDELAHYCNWCGRWFAESIEDGDFCAECSQRLAEHFKKEPA